MVNRLFSRQSTLLLLAMVAVALLLESLGIGTTSIAAKRRNVLAQTEALARATGDREAIAFSASELGNWRLRCLPGDIARATNLYQQALLLPATEIGIEEIIVQPGVAKPVRNLGYRIPCQIRAAMTPPQLGAYLDRICSMDLMQKVRRLDVADLSKRNSLSPGLKRVEIMVEAISTPGAQDRQEISSHAMTMSVAKLLQKKPLFTRDVGSAVQTLPVANKTKPPVVTPQPHPLSHLRYVASFSKRGVWQAWLYDNATNEQYTLTQGDRVVAGERTLSVLAIGEDFVEVEIDGVAARIELGQSLIAKKLSAM